MLRSLKRIIRDLLELLNLLIMPRWKYSIVLYGEIRALKFISDEDFEKAIKLLYSQKLRECPYDLVGDNTIIIPVQAVRYFKKEKLDFKDTRVIRAGELPPQERYKLRKQGTF